MGPLNTSIPETCHETTKMIMSFILVLKVSCTFSLTVYHQIGFQMKHKAAVCINHQLQINIHPSITY